MPRPVGLQREFFQYRTMPKMGHFPLPEGAKELFPEEKETNA
jgi:hypothetical protein